jgi:8-oxo-dGTP diphosphatase
VNLSRRMLPASHPDAVYVPDFFEPGHGAYVESDAVYAERTKKEKMKMKEYVVGFAFSSDKTRVLLIKKKRAPANVPHMVDKWNGVGGKIESGELPIEAMCREFKEETGVDTAKYIWDKFLVLRGDGFNVVFFHCFNDVVVNHGATTEDEIVGPFYVKGLPSNVMPNLRWLIPMALGHLDDHVAVYTVDETETSAVAEKEASIG